MKILAQITDSKISTILNSFGYCVQPYKIQQQLVYVTGRQDEEDGKTLVRDKQDRAINSVFCRDLHLTQPAQQALFQSSYCAKVRALIPAFSTNSRGTLATQATLNINVSGLLQKDLFKGKVKLREKLFQTTLLSRLSHKVCRLLSSPIQMSKLTNVKQTFSMFFQLLTWIS